MDLCHVKRSASQYWICVTDAYTNKGKVTSDKEVSPSFDSLNKQKLAERKKRLTKHNL